MEASIPNLKVFVWRKDSDSWNYWMEVVSLTLLDSGIAMFDNVTVIGGAQDLDAVCYMVVHLDFAFRPLPPAPSVLSHKTRTQQVLVLACECTCLCTDFIYSKISLLSSLHFLRMSLSSFVLYMWHIVSYCLLDEMCCLLDEIFSLKDEPQKILFRGTTKKLASLVPWRQNAKWWKPSTESIATSSKYFRIQIFWDIPRAYGQGQICISGSMGKIISGENFLPF